ncbi:MAG: ABC transporter permease [Candidatus Saccharimonadia bacterium]
MKLYFKEFNGRKVFLIVCCAIILAAIWLYSAMYPSIQAQSASLTKALESFGPAMKAFGVSNFSLDTLQKFLAIELFSITWPVLTIILSISIAGQTLAGETEKATIGTILALPISRTKIVLAKYFSGLSAITIFVAISTFSAIPIATLYRFTFQSINFVNLAVLCLLFSWAIYSVAMMFSAILNEKGQVFMVMGGSLLLMYIANLLGEMSNKVSWLRYVSIFHWFNASDVLVSNHVNLMAYLIYGVIILLSGSFGLIWFNRKDVIV